MNIFLKLIGLKKIPKKLLAATLTCTLPILVGVSAPAVALDYQLEGTLGPSSPSTAPYGDFFGFSGTFSTPDNEPVT